ncbi:MAG: glucans biosynthesis glucosyltransferase MdoH [Thermodesulfobacteriota bacterium]
MDSAIFDRPWGHTAFVRRILLIAMVLVPTYFATGYMAYVLPHGGTAPMEILVVTLFAILYAWISVGFWTAMVGWFLLMRGTDRFSISRIAARPEETGIAAQARTAIVIPIYNEDVSRVYAGLSTVLDSLAKTGRAGGFDLFILSDPGNPDIRIQEEMAWAALQRRFADLPCGIYYRQRRSNTKRKSGNVADFCRRWGRNYRYMIVLDADSIVVGPTLVQMVKIMEQRKAIGILQTAPKTINRHTLIARLQQFANHLYGPVFAAGLHFWQLGDSQFWGHNAIIRVAPFMAHCALPRLSGKPPLGGDILSHDFVEAALMRRAGYEVWLAYDIEGSYEEPPPTLLDELKRDRRWCQGNLQHLRLLFTRGLFGAHRALFFNRVLAYGSALLWFLFLAASTIMAVLHEIRQPDYFPSGRSLFPNWPVWEPQWALVLLASTAVILFLPKICSIIYVCCRQHRAHLFGQWGQLTVSFVLEIVFSTLLAPTRMLFHARFVFLTLLGRQISWEAQERKDIGTPWREAARFHGGATAFALCWAAALFVINRAFFWWLSPILISLMLSIPLSVWTSRKTFGRAFRRFGLFLIPEEVATPPELIQLNREIAEAEQMLAPARAIAVPAGFIRAVVDPCVYSLHMRTFSENNTACSKTGGHLKAICEKAWLWGPQTLESREKQAILSSPASMAWLHRKVWEISNDRLSRKWGLP